jgi:hypothetical protein
LIEEHGNDSLPTSNENLIPIETAETIALAQKKAAEQVEQYRLAKKQKKMLQKQLPQKKDQKIVKKPFFTKRRNRKTSMDDGYETVPLDPTIISYYSVHPSYNTGGIRLLTTAQKESNTLENLFIEVEEKPRTPI